MIEELEKLMSFCSVSSDQNAVGQLLDYVQDRLEQRGLKVERIENEGIRSLYASTKGTHASKVLLQGHIDVVPGDNTFIRTDTEIHGRGSYDMLYGTASFLRIIDELENVSGYDIGILLTGDEELGGEKGVGALLRDPSYTCDVCLLPDAGEGLGSMNVAAKGILQTQIKVKGTSHHGSRPWEGDGAAAKLIRLINELQLAFDTSDKFNSTLTITQLSTGAAAINQGPASAQVGVDIRLKDEREFTRIRGILSDLLKKYDGEVVFEHTGKVYELDTDNPYVKDFIGLYAEIVGKDIEFTRAHGSSDARFFAEKGIPVIMIRPDGGNAHGDDEWLSVTAWEAFHTVLDRYVRRTAVVTEV